MTETFSILLTRFKKASITDIIFVVSPRQKMLQSYLKKSPELEKLLIKRKKDQQLQELKDFEELFEGLNISYVTQKQPLGDGHALLQASKLLARTKLRT